MPNKIFISYNHNDKILIDTIARRLELEFGRNNIFYDAWSIQPGDSIIGKMNEGLGDFKTFFFFVSPNSLQSKMVSLEWQTALNRAVNEQLKFVAVRIADCSMPTILTDKIYIDLYGEGLDSAVEKMRLVISGENTYKPLDNVQNLVVEYNYKDDNKIHICIRALYYAENTPTFAVASNISLDDFRIQSISDGVSMTGHAVFNAISPQLNAHTVGLLRAVKPGAPFIADIVFTDIKAVTHFKVLLLTDSEIGRFQFLDLQQKA